MRSSPGTGASKMAAGACFIIARNPIGIYRTVTVTHRTDGTTSGWSKGTRRMASSFTAMARPSAGASSGALWNCLESTPVESIATSGGPGTLSRIGGLPASLWIAATADQGLPRLL
jgi:hypothetical protein